MAVLRLLESLDAEIVHYSDAALTVTSRGRAVTLTDAGGSRHFRLPGAFHEPAVAWSRLARRFLRLDKCNVIPLRDCLVAIRQGRVYRIDLHDGSIRETLRLEHGRNILHQSVARTPAGKIWFGEYDSNRNREAVAIYCSEDSGTSWQIVYRFERGTIRHVHSVAYDPVWNGLWVFTGDLDGECRVLFTGNEFGRVQQIGDRTQLFRACGAFFEENSVHWLMDSPLTQCFHVRFDRAEDRVETLDPLPGPVWYSKHLSDGVYIAATALERGPGVREHAAVVLYSRDLVHWESVARFEHDRLPLGLFKFGVVGFADGDHSSTAFPMFFEALRGLDGKAWLCAIEDAQ